MSERHLIEVWSDDFDAPERDDLVTNLARFCLTAPDFYVNGPVPGVVDVIACITGDLYDVHSFIRAERRASRPARLVHRLGPQHLIAFSIR